MNSPTRRLEPVTVADAIDRFSRLKQMNTPDWKCDNLEALSNLLGENIPLETITAGGLNRAFHSPKANVLNLHNTSCEQDLRLFLDFCYEMGFINEELRSAPIVTPYKGGPSRRRNTRTIGKINYLSAQGKKRIEEELEYLYKDQRPKLAKWLSIAAPDSGPGRPGFDHPKEIQSLVEGRIAECEAYLKTAVVIEAARFKFLFPECINVGDTIEMLESGDKASYTLVGTIEVDPSKGWISFRSPIGQAIVGRMPGDKFSLSVPAGIIQLSILDFRREVIEYVKPNHFVDYVGKSF